MKLKHKNQSKKRIILISTILVFLVGISLVVYKNTRPTEVMKGESSNSKTTSSAPTAQETFSDGTERDPGNSLNENEGSGTVTDNQGSVVSADNESEWIDSQTGEITVYSPVMNSKLKSGNEISGQSTLSNVSFRIIDDVSGVIGEGQLTVKNGKFSGSLDFTTSADEGRIDIFAVKADGQEYSNIGIPVKFK